MSSYAEPTDARRAAVMERLADTVQQGIDVTVDELQARMSRTTKPKITENLSERIEFLHGQALGNTMAMLASYGTETLEYVASSFTSTSALRDRLIYWRTYNGDQWNEVAGEHRDAMFRDMIALRHLSFGTADINVYGLLETYAVLNASPGSICQMTGHARDGVEAVYRVIMESRTRACLRLTNKEKRPDTSTHITPEVVQYLVESPEQGRKLHRFLWSNKKTLPEIDFGYFLAWVDSHQSLSEGVL